MKQRTLVAMIVEWDDTHTRDPRNWDWQATINSDLPDGAIGKVDVNPLNVTTHRMETVMDDEDEAWMIEEIDDRVADFIGNYSSDDLWEDPEDRRNTQLDIL